MITKVAVINIKTIKYMKASELIKKRIQIEEIYGTIEKAN